MIHKKNRLMMVVCVFASMGVVLGIQADVVLVPVPEGAVACLSRKDAANYGVYAKQAPDFAADLLARASCFEVSKAEDAIKLGHEKGFDKLKLLSGHTIWLPEAR